MTTDILFEEVSGQHGKNIGLITLNRQQALNALNHEMFIAIYDYLQKWQTAASIKAVIIRAAPGRAFSAGGDIRAVYQGKITNNTNFSHIFIDEYKVNKLIHHYSKPYIAILDGITMGGGAGLSMHASYRIATERLIFAMPETNIGFFPDIGASYFLSRLPHCMGIYLGLTSEKIAYNDCYALGLVDAVIDFHSQEMLLQLFAEQESLDKSVIENSIKKWLIPVPKSTLLEHQHEIETCFSKNTVEEIIDALHTYGSDWCVKTAEILLKKSPTSLKVTLQEIHQGKLLDFNSCMQMENHIMQQMIQGHDFFEGIRAAIIDKDQNPQWKPAKLADVKVEDVECYF